jgi:glucose/arabinose dehydrogenase
MRFNFFSCFMLLLFPLCLKSQPGKVNMTPVQSLNLQQVAIEVPAKYALAFPAGKTLKIPQGYKVKVFYAGGLSRPRFLAFDANGVLHVADEVKNAIYAMPDKNNDGIADTMFIAASGFHDSHDVTFYKGAMYVTDSNKIWKCIDANGDGVYESRTIFIDSIAYGATKGGHHTRTLVFDSLNHKAYLSIGSSCNVCRENQKAIIEQYNDDGTGKRTYANGIRNGIGMALHPVTNKLWANNNGSDWEGNEIPPEWFDIIRDGGFYGHPFAYANQVWFNFNAYPDYQALLPITTTDSAKVKTMIEPAALIRAHSAPMALAFLNSSFGTTYRYGFLSALHGSWNSPQSFRGYKVIYLDLSSDNDTTVNYTADFIDGFLTDTINRVYWGRPVGLATDKAGSVYLSSDETNKFILKIYPEFPIGMNEQDHGGFKLYPNPARNEIRIENGKWKIENDEYRIYNLTGQVLLLGQVNNKETIIDISSLAKGIYFVKVGEVVRKVVKE